MFHNGNESERIAHTNKWREVSLAVIGSSPVHSTTNIPVMAAVNYSGASKWFIKWDAIKQTESCARLDVIEGSNPSTGFT